MHLMIHREELVRALARAQGIAGKRSTSPVLSSVLLQASGETLRATATDQAITLVADYAATIKTPGEVAVDATNFFQAAKVLRGDIVTLKLLDNGRLEVRSGSTVYNLTTIPSTEFPVAAAPWHARALFVRASDLRHTIDRVHFSVAGDDNRYGLNGAHVEDVSTHRHRLLRFVGTDGNRLTWAQMPYRGALGIGRKMLLPRKGLGEVRKLLEGYEGEVGIAFGERDALVEWPGVMVHLMLLEADFPDYRQVLPSTFKRRAVVEKSALRDALWGVSILATDASNSVKFQFSSEGLVLSARKLDAGDSRDEVPMGYSGEPIAMGFNARFVGEVLAVIGGSRVSFEFGDALSPCIIRDVDAESVAFVVMPVCLD